MIVGSPTRLAINTLRDTNGIELVNDTVTIGDSLKIFAAIYDSKNNFINNVSVNWTLNQNLGNLSPAAASDSSAFYPTTTGSTSIRANSATYGLSDQTGIITVFAGRPDSLRIITAAVDTVTPNQIIELKVKLIDSLKNAVRDSIVRFNITSGSGTLSAASDTTDPLGFASVRFTAPQQAGSTLISAYVTTLTDDTAKFTVTTVPASLAYYRIIPSTLSDTAGSAVTVTVTAFDVFNNQLDDDTTQTRIDIYGSKTGLNGGGAGITPKINILTNGQHTSVVRDSVKENIQIKVTGRFDTTKTAITEFVTIREASPFVAEFYPDSLSNVQSGQLGVALIDSSALIVKDRFGNAVNDTITVRWLPTSTASVNPAIRTTTLDGTARTRWTLRTATASNDTMLAVVPVIGDTLRFIANILATGNDTLIRVSALADSDTVNMRLDNTFRVYVEDEFANPQSGVKITFSLFSSPGATDSAGFVASNGEYVTTLDTLTDINGFAEAVFHPGTKTGQHIIRASNPELKNPAVYDTVTGVHDVPNNLQIIAGNNQNLTAGSVSDTLKVLITDRYGNTLEQSAEQIYWQTIYTGLPVSAAGNIDILPNPQNFTTLDSAVIGTVSSSYALWQMRQVLGYDTVIAYLRNKDTVLFRAIVSPREADTVLVFAGNLMTGINNGNSITLKTLVKDTFGNKVPSAYVKYQIISGSAVFSGGDSSLTDVNGISTILVKPGNADSTTIRATATSASVSAEFKIYDLVYVDSTLTPNRVRRDTTTSFSVAVYNNGPYDIRLDTSQTMFRFTDGILFYQTSLQSHDTIISGNSFDTLHFVTDTIDGNLKNTTYTPKINIAGFVPALDQNMSGILETVPNELEVLGVKVISVQTPAPKLFSRGDTLIISIEVRNPNISTMTTVDFGLRTSQAGVLQRVGMVDLSSIPAKGFRTFNDTVRILPSSPVGKIFVDAFYFGNIGSINFADSLSTLIDSLFIQSDAEVSYVTGSINPVTVSEGQTATIRLSVKNDSLAAVTLDPNKTYFKFGADSVNLANSQVISGSGDTSQLVFRSLNVASLSGTYAGSLYLWGTENGGRFADTLSLGTDSIRVQTAVNVTRLTIDSVLIENDTTAQNSDTLKLRLKISNTAQASAILDSIRLSYRRSGSAASGYSVVNTVFSLPDTLNGLTSNYYVIDVRIASSADTGSIVVDGYVRARDKNSNLITQVLNAGETDSIYVKSKSRVMITAVSTPTADTVSLGQINIPMNVTLTNAGAAPFRLDDLRMRFAIGLYDTALTQSLPDTIWGYQSKTYNFIANVKNNSAVGLDSLGATASGFDLLNGKSSTVTASGLDTLVILSPTQILLTSVQTQPIFVSRSQDSILVRVTLKNNGASVGQIDTVRLKFFDVSSSADAAGFTYNRYSDVSDTISGSVSKTFDFKVSIGPAADTGRILIDAFMTGSDIVSGLAFYDSGAVTTDFWTVQIPADIVVDSVYSTVESATKGQINIPVTVLVRNNGEANAVLDSIRLRYFYGAVPDFASYVDTLIAPNGTVIAESGRTVQYSFTADIISSAPSGLVSLFAHAYGRDQNNQKLVADTLRNKYDSVLIQSPPALNYVANSLIPDTVNKSSAVSFALDVINTGEATLLLNASTTLILRDVDSLKVNLRDTVYVESGITRQLVFNSATVNLRSDSVYYPELVIRGTENGNNYSNYLPITNDSVRVLNASVAAADSLNFYDLSGNYITKTAANDSFIVRLLIRNNGGATIKNLVPNPASPALSGSSIPSLYTGPVPASVNLASNDSIRFEWRYRADSSGSANFAVRAQGKDATTDSTITSNLLNAFLTITAPTADTLVAVSALSQTIPAYTSTDLAVRVTDENSIPAKKDSVQFTVRSGNAGFGDSSRVTLDTVVFTNSDGIASVRLFTAALVNNSSVTARLLSTADDSVQFAVSTEPRAISYLALDADTFWTAGVEDSVIVSAFDQFGNLATNASGNIQVSQVPASAMAFTLSASEPIISGIARFAGRDTLAKSQTQIRARATVTGTQVLSQVLTIRHNEAYRFVDTIKNISGVAYSNSIVLTAKVEDRYGNAVKDTMIRFSVLHPAQNGVLLTASSVLTDSLGQASATYRTGDSVGLNVVAATKATAMPGSMDSVYFNITTDSLDANASYIAGSLTPKVITRNQSVAFKAKFENTGTFPIQLRGDSTYIEFGAGGNYFRSYLDTLVNRTIGADGISQIAFRDSQVNLAAGLYPSATDSAVIVLWGTVFDSSTSDYDTLRFRYGNNILDTLTVQNPAQLVINSVAITQTRAVRGQDSIRVDYSISNTGGTVARSITWKDSIGSGVQDVTSQWTLIGGDALDSLVNGDTVQLVRYYRVNTTAPLGMHYVSSRVRGIDYNDNQQVTTAALINPDSLEVFRSAVLTAMADSFRVYRNGNEIPNNTVYAGETFELRMKVRNDSGSVVLGLMPNPLTPDSLGSGQISLVSGPAVSLSRLESGDSSVISWFYRVDNNGLGTLTFTAGSEGLDSVNNSLRILSNKVTRLVTMTHAVLDTIELVSGTDSNLSVIARQTAQLEVEVKDQFGNAVIDSSVRLVTVSDSGGFNIGQTLKDTVIRSDANGKVRITYYAPVKTQNVTVKAYPLYATPDQDTVRYHISILPAAISYLRLQTDTNWTAGDPDSVLVSAYDQYNNLTINASETVSLTQVTGSTMYYLPSGTEALVNGVARFAGRDTVARQQTQIKAEVTGLSTQVLSQIITIIHNEAYRFVDTVDSITGIGFGNAVVLTAKVEDRYGNAVKDTMIRFSVLHPAQNGVLLTASSVLTDSLGQASATYRTGDSVGLNVVAATKATAMPGSMDSVYFNITTDSLDANASYIAGSLTPKVITRNQSVAFKAKFENTGTFPIQLRGDSTYIEFGAGGNYFRSYLDTLVNRTIGADGISQIAFRDSQVNLAAGLYPSATDSAVIVLWGTVFDSSTSDYDTLRFRYGNNILDTLTVQNPAQLVINSVAITQTRAVRGQDSIRVDYSISNTGGTVARSITWKDSIGSGVQDVTSQWTLIGGDALDSLVNGDTVQLVRYYRVNTTAPLGMHYVSSRVRGIDYNDNQQVTTAALINPDSLEVFRSAVLTAMADSFRVYRNGNEIPNNTVYAGETFELRMKVRNDSGSVVLGLMPNPLTPDSLGSGQISLVSGPAVSLSRLESGDSSVISWFYRVDNNGLGTLTFTAGSEGLDSVNNSLRILSNKVTRLVTMTHAVLDTIELVSGTDSNLSVIARQTAQLEVEVKDQFGNAVIDSSVRLVTVSDSGGFNIGQTLKDTVIRSDANGKVRITYYAPVKTQNVTVKAYPLYATPDQDTVRYHISILPAAISYLTIDVDTVWIAGRRDSVIINAYDQYNNLNNLDTTTILITGNPADNTLFEPSAIQLDSGSAIVLGRNTRAQINFQVRVTTLNTGTQRTSEPIRIVHTSAYEFAQADSVKLYDIIVNKKRQLNATVIDTFGNPVNNFNVRYIVTQNQGTGSINGFSQYDTLTLVDGTTSAIYTTGGTEGTNLIKAIGQTTPLLDSVTYVLQTINPVLPSRYNLVTIDPDTVSQKQTSVFRIQINNQGPFTITLIPDSTRLEFFNNDSNVSVAVTLDSLVKSLPDSSITQVQFKAVTALLPAADYPMGLNTANVRLVGAITDSTTGLKDTVVIPLTFNNHDTLNIRQPAALQLSDVRFDLDSAVQGQTGLRIQYTVNNLGDNTAVNLSVIDHFSAGGAISTGQWLLVNDQRPAVFDTGITLFNRYYQLDGKSVTGMHDLSVRLYGYDRIDPLQLIADSLLQHDSIKVLRSSDVQIVFTTVDTVYTDSLINRNQIVRMRSIVQNNGDEAVKVRMRFTASGSSFSEAVTLNSLNANSSQIVTSSYFNTQNTRGIETYSAVIDTLFSLVNGDTLTISDSLQGNTRTLVVQDSAKLNVVLTVKGSDPKSLIVSDSSEFFLYLRVDNIGEADLTRDSVPVNIHVPAPYRLSYAGTRDTLLYAVIGTDKPVSVLAFDSTVAFNRFTARLDTSLGTYPLDTNNRRKAVYLSDSDNVQIRTSSVGRLTPLSFNIISPLGATDGTVSTFQSFTIRARVASLDRLANIRGTIQLPAGFSTPDSLSQNMNPPVTALTDSVQWRIFASDTTGNNFNFSVQFSGEDTTTGLKRNSLPLTLPVTVVRRAELSVDLRITDPPGAIDDTISTSQTFTVQAVVTNNGTADISGGLLRLGFPAGFVNTTLPDTQAFAVNTPVTWTLRAPDNSAFTAIFRQMTAKGRHIHIKSETDTDGRVRSRWINAGSALISRDQLTDQEETLQKRIESLDLMNSLLLSGDLAASIERLPSDVNSSLPAAVVKGSDTVKVTVVQAAQIANKQITMRNAVSTEQSFTVKFSVAQNPSLTSRNATIVLPAGFTTVDTLQKNMSDEDTVVTWTINAPVSLAPGLDQDLYSIKVRFAGRDRNQPLYVLDSLGNDITVQTKPRLVMTAVITEPENAKDHFVSMGQSFRVSVNVRKLGRANITGSGLIMMDRSSLTIPGSTGGSGQFRVMPEDSVYDLQTGDSTTTWLFTAPNDTVISHPLRFAFTSILPADSNTALPASVVNSSITINISTEKKILKVTNVPTWKDKKSAFNTEMIDSLMVIIMENTGPSQNTNSILAQAFRFIIERYNPSAGHYPYTRVAPGEYLNTDSLMVRIIDEPEFLGHSSLSQDTLIVNVDQLAQLSKKKNAGINAAVNWTQGILVNKNNPVTLSFDGKLASTVAQQNRNYRIRLVDIIAFDYDTLSDLALNNNPLTNPLTVVDPLGRPISDSTGDMSSVTMRFIDQNGSGTDQFSNYPNPFGSGERSRTTFFFVPKQDDDNAKIEIYTLAGNPVKTIRGRVFRNSIPSTLIWDGTNGKGDKVRNGVYIAILKVNGMSKLKTKVLIAR